MGLAPSDMHPDVNIMLLTHTWTAQKVNMVIAWSSVRWDKAGDCNHSLYGPCFGSQNQRRSSLKCYAHYHGMFKKSGKANIFGRVDIFAEKRNRDGV